LLLFSTNIIFLHVHSEHSRLRHFYEPVLRLSDGPGLEVELLHLLVDVAGWRTRSQHTLPHPVLPLLQFTDPPAAYDDSEGGGDDQEREEDGRETDDCHNFACLRTPPFLN